MSEVIHYIRRAQGSAVITPRTMCERFPFAAEDSVDEIVGEMGDAHMCDPSQMFKVCIRATLTPNLNV
jgi:hypothetical protein